MEPRGHGGRVDGRTPMIRASAADLKFLHRLRQTHSRNFKSKSGTRIICLLVPPLLPKFVSEGAAIYHELRKRGTGIFMKEDVMNRLEKVLYTAKAHTYEPVVA